jgi:hypothetical protein
LSAQRRATGPRKSTISSLENAPRDAAAARLTAALVDRAGATVTPRKQEDPQHRRCILRGA